MKKNRYVLIALVAGIIWFTLSFLLLHQWGAFASDFMKPWRGARALLSGQDPYQVIQGGGNYPFEYPLFYPLPAAILAIPFGFIDDPYVAGAVFFGCSSSLLAFTILRYDWKKFPVFLSAPFFVSASVAQFTPLILALALMPPTWQSIALLTKPTSGLTSFLYKPSARTILITLILIIPTLLWIPRWPIEWLTAIRDTRGIYFIPLLSTGGPLLLLGLLAWRSKEGRAFLGTSLVPHHPYWYESVLLWLVPQTLRQSLVLALLSWVAYFGWLLSHPQDEIINSTWPWQIYLVYLPCAVLLAFPHLTLAAKKLSESFRSTLQHPNLK
ncbi:MAG: hypothetical protein P8Z00_10005 [Anaerolineales bacterium]